ncbi:hypothetical protein FBD94_16335 [Pedobacter hiemivivus]|uniref:Uncharacterized protein n=1 Tax=Pedobacter hiemivivus TaxID=2530454 RepID=A0A4U1G6R4_9SPHI|nr:hypothetical protein [Pedobacter hiemivivus]TKC59104.1 hypothetical protein FBD94_16335 [Pedobacter hiemivivus]
MQEDSYTFKRHSKAHEYEFFSEGAKGTIRKMIQFQSLPDHNNMYNLAFGDWDEENGTINDHVKTNDGDRQKILKTVAKTVYDFMQGNGNIKIIARGSTPSRTRLYQMGIAAFWLDIREHFNVDGYISNEWESFRPNRNYEAFLLMHKELTIFE